MHFQHNIHFFKKMSLPQLLAQCRSAFRRLHFVRLGGENDGLARSLRYSEATDHPVVAGLAAELRRIRTARSIRVGNAASR